MLVGPLLEEQTQGFEDLLVLGALLVHVKVHLGLIVPIVLVDAKGMAALLGQAFALRKAKVHSDLPMVSEEPNTMIEAQRTSFDERDVEQSIAALKRGAYLLKYGRRGKPKFCPFRLSTKVQHELLSVYATQLLEKEHSGCHALLRDDKVEDLSRMYRLFSKIPRGLDPVSSIFKQHVTAEGTALVKQAEDAASNKKVM
ncbi:uncharacterized protein LOC114283153 [Camellia sinensis]|uniref:uncharacterized protein LOC114283153 n=1 Tax=Camellia sinensis TaxID=4442 RepID=UPI0010357E5B|nr:uncharacterized protein LOC114283153 [Camellia sinensis]